jgi:uncharacterized protein YciI
MYLLNGTLKYSLDKIASYVEAHVEWLNKGLEQKIVLFAGPKTDWTGSLIIVNSIPDCELNAYVTADPFVIADIVSYSITNFEVAYLQDNLNSFINVLE